MFSKNPVTKLMAITVIAGIIELSCILTGIMFQRHFINQYQQTNRIYTDALQDAENVLSYTYLYESTIYKASLDLGSNVDYEQTYDTIGRQLSSELSSLQSSKALESGTVRTAYENVVSDVESLFASDKDSVAKTVDKIASDTALLVTYLKTDMVASSEKISKMNRYSYLLDAAAIMVSLISIVACINLVSKNSKQMLEEKELENYTDGLTGLYNRKYVEERLAEKVNAGERGFLFMFDMDNFKKVNDTYGHDAGDAVLTGFSEVLRDTLRNNDVACRLGGDEFMVFVSGIRVNRDATALADRIITNTRKKFANSNGKIITLSCGIARTQVHETFDVLYKRADTALYYVKEHGKNSYHIE